MEQEKLYEASPEMVDEYEESSGSLGVIRIEPEEEHHEDLPFEGARCTLIDPMKVDDWHRTMTFYTFKVDNKVCKLVVDSGSCINAISIKVVKCLCLIPVDHLSPYSLSWVDMTTIPANSRCRVSIQL